MKCLVIALSIALTLLVFANASNNIDSIGSHDVSMIEELHKDLSKLHQLESDSCECPKQPPCACVSQPCSCPPPPPCECKKPVQHTHTTHTVTHTHTVKEVEPIQKVTKLVVVPPPRHLAEEKFKKDERGYKEKKLKAEKVFKEKKKKFQAKLHLEKQRIARHYANITKKADSLKQIVHAEQQRQIADAGRQSKMANMLKDEQKHLHEKHELHKMAQEKINELNNLHKKMNVSEEHMKETQKKTYHHLVKVQKQTKEEQKVKSEAVETTLSKVQNKLDTAHEDEIKAHHEIDDELHQYGNATKHSVQAKANQTLTDAVHKAHTIVHKAKEILHTAQHKAKAEINAAHTNRKEHNIKSKKMRQQKRKTAAEDLQKAKKKVKSFMSRTREANKKSHKQREVHNKENLHKMNMYREQLTQQIKSARQLRIEAAKKSQKAKLLVYKATSKTTNDEQRMKFKHRLIVENHQKQRARLSRRLRHEVNQKALQAVALKKKMVQEHLDTMRQNYKTYIESVNVWQNTVYSEFKKKIKIMAPNMQIPNPPTRTPNDAR